MSELVLRIAGFEGALVDLLAQVRRRAIEILTVPLAQVTRQLVEWVGAGTKPDAGLLADYCDETSSLLLLKSRALLPRERERELTDDEPDPAELEARLAAYRRYRTAAEQLQEREREGLHAFPRTAPPPPQDAPAVLAAGEVSPEDLAAAFRAALLQMPAPVEEPEPVPVHRVRIADRLAGIGALLRAKGKVRFLDAITDGPRTREFVIVSFLAVLELLRRSAVLVRQEGLFGDIVVEIRSQEALDAVLSSGSTFLDEDC